MKGSVSDNVGVVRLEVYDGPTLLKSSLSGSRWTLVWQPQDTSQKLRIVAYDAAGNKGESQLEFRSLALSDPADLVEPDLLLRLPTSPGTVTRYTLDGSAPTPTSLAYQGPLVLQSRVGQPAPLSLIPTNQAATPEDFRWKPPQGDVKMATVVRAQEFRGGEPVGPVLTHTYLINQKSYSLPVVSLATDPDNFFGPTQGIYVPGATYDKAGTVPPQDRPGNYDQKGKEWERPIHVEWFEPDGHLGLSQDAGVRISGVISARYPEKSLNLNASGKYGKKSFKYPFFPGLEQQSFKSLTLRSSGQDFLWTKFKDCMLHGLLAQQTQLDVQACRPAVVFLDGEYWGLHDLREQNNEDYLAAHHGLDAKDIVILAGTGWLDQGKPGDEVSYQALTDFLGSHDLADPANYAQVAAQIDIDDFIDYNIFEIYIANLDWPENNVKFWRARPDSRKPETPASQGERWRYLIYDSDLSMFGPENNTLSRALGQNTSMPVSADSTVLLGRLMANATFKSQFISRFRAQMKTLYSPEKMLGEINRFARLLAPEIPEDLQRWNYPASFSEWQENVENLRYFVNERPAYMTQFLDELERTH